MAKIVISRNDQVLQEVDLHPGRMTLGRHPRCDIVIDHPAVSAHHAAFEVRTEDAVVEDLDSTNGTFVNGLRVSRRVLQDADRITVALFRVDYDANGTAAEVTAAPAAVGRIEVKDGPNAGKSLSLSKPVSTLGRPGVQVVAITRRDGDYFIHHVEGDIPALLNGAPARAAPRRLSDGDTIEVTGTTMTFRMRAG